MIKSSKIIHFHELLSEIVRDFGEEILTEARLKGIISDMSAGSDISKFQTIIGRSISYHIGQRILKFRDLDEADFILRINTLKQTFQEENFFQHGISDYIVDSYLFALGWIDQLDGYEETVESSAQSGELSFVERGGEEYCGNISKEDERSGFGISKREDGSYFAGEWKLDMKNGIGMDVAVEHAKYAGEWRLNRKNGIGAIIQSDGMRYAGEWKNGKMHGIGTLFYPTGERMWTRFANGKITQDVGVYFMQDGTSIRGRMTDHGPDGQCLHYRKDGSCNTEKWSNGIKKQ